MIEATDDIPEDTLVEEGSGETDRGLGDDDGPEEIIGYEGDGRNTTTTAMV